MTERYLPQQFFEIIIITMGFTAYDMQVGLALIN
jgi:hypothetical protein